MLDKIKSLGSDTAVYGVSTVVGRFLTFILTPIYTHLLAERSELGVVANVYAYIAFLNIVYVYGMESAYFKYASTLEIGDERDNFSVPFLSLSATSLILSACMFWQSGPLTHLAGIPSVYESVVTYSAGILLFDTLSVIPFARLRLQRKAVRFAAIKLIAIVANVLLNILFLLRYHMGVEGIFLAGVISSAVTVILLIPTIVQALRPVMLTSLLRPLLRFGLPYVPAGLAAMMIQVVDRPILQSLTNLDTVGLYQVNYRLGIFMMLIVSTFDFAWRPFFLSHAGDPEAKPMFARILTYFYLFMILVFIFITLFLRDIVTSPLFFGKPIISEPYWSGLSIVPVVLLGYIFLGISNNLVAGIYIEKKTKHLPAITFVGLAVNVGVNYMLIPVMGIMGAALATLLSYSVMAVVLFVVVQRFYPVRYEFVRLAKITVSALIVMGLYLAVPPPFPSLVWKAILLAVFVVTMYGMRFLESSELRVLIQLFRPRSSPGEPDIPR